MIPEVIRSKLSGKIYNFASFLKKSACEIVTSPHTCKSYPVVLQEFILLRYAGFIIVQMKIYKDISGFTFKKPVATIGFFDGVHLAHQSIIRKLKTIAAELKGESVVITLWPHPRIILKKTDEEIYLLNTLEEKIEKIEETGIDNLVILPFDTTFASIPFAEFVEEYLVKKLGIYHLIVGYNHHFGKNREGNFENLNHLAEKFSFGLSQQEQVTVREERVSSSHIRKLILNGQIEKANEFLGYTFNLHGKVVRGVKIGRQIGFPTANLAISEHSKILPLKGVYAVMVELEGKMYKGMMNIGCRPTIDKDCLKDTLEVHLFDFSGDIYSKELRVYFVKRIRDEQRFVDIPSLVGQITKDEESIKNVLSLVKFENRKLVI
jgi:riboflavin kinase / FMN adenylyltransferase